MTTTELDSDMPDIARKSCDPDFDDAWRLFTAMHDAFKLDGAGSCRVARQVSRHVQAFDDITDLVGFGGGGLIKRVNAAVLDAPLQ